MKINIHLTNGLLVLFNKVTQRGQEFGPVTNLSSVSYHTNDQTNGGPYQRRGVPYRI